MRCLLAFTILISSFAAHADFESIWGQKPTRIEKIAILNANYSLKAYELNFSPDPVPNRKNSRAIEKYVAFVIELEAAAPYREVTKQDLEKVVPAKCDESAQLFVANSAKPNLKITYTVNELTSKYSTHPNDADLTALCVVAFKFEKN